MKGLKVVQFEKQIQKKRKIAKLRTFQILLKFKTQGSNYSLLFLNKY